MKQIVIEVMPSPFQRGQYVLTLGCGHLWSYTGDPAPPLRSEINCIHCDRHSDREPECYDVVREMDELMRELRIDRGRRAGLLP